MSEKLLPCPCGGGIPEILDVLSDIEDLGRYQCKRCKMNFSLLFLIKFEGNKPVFRCEDEQEDAATSWNNGVLNLMKITRCKDCKYSIQSPEVGVIMCDRDEHLNGIYESYYPNEHYPDNHYCAFGKPRKEGE